MALTEEDRSAFRRDGYTVVRDVLSSDQVARLRSHLRPQFDVPDARRLPGDNPQFLFDVFSRDPELRWLLFHAPAIAALRYFLGNDFVVLRETVAQLNRFGGWHKDTTSQERAGLTFHRQPDFLMVEAGYYLQDNTAELGGGLDVEPGSHVAADPYVEPATFDRVRRRVGMRERDPKRVVRLDSRAGDLVIFDFRVNHRATPARTSGGPDKLAIFIACSSNTPHVDAYHRFISERSEYKYLRGFRYPDDLAQAAAEARIILA